MELAFLRGKHTIFIYVFIHFWPHAVACGILVPQPETEPLPWAVKAQSPNHWTTREFLKAYYK